VRVLLKFDVKSNMECIASGAKYVLDAETADLIDGCRDLFDDS